MFCVKRKHRKTLDAIFRHPIQSGVTWTDIESLLVASGAHIEELAGSTLS